MIGRGVVAPKWLKSSAGHRRVSFVYTRRMFRWWGEWRASAQRNKHLRRCMPSSRGMLLSTIRSHAFPSVNGPATSCMPRVWDLSLCLWEYLDHPIATHHQGLAKRDSRGTPGLSIEAGTSQQGLDRHVRPWPVIGGTEIYDREDPRSKPERLASLFEVKAQNLLVLLDSDLAASSLAPHRVFLMPFESCPAQLRRAHGSFRSMLCAFQQIPALGAVA